MRNFLIAGNWKMNKGPSETRQLLSELKDTQAEIPESVDVLVCPPSISLTVASDALENYDVSLGAQNVYFEDNGAYTGEISTSMLNDAGCDYVIVGHSERRQYFGETDTTVNKRVKKALAAGIKPIVCVGESLEQRQKGQHVNLVKKQVKAALVEVDKEDAEEVVIAYEPIWAIGTGETATPDQAQEMHRIIRSELAELLDDDAAENMRILYGGSMKPHNAEELLGQDDVDGGLIGGASLKADSFSEIIQIADKLS